ncbi:site-specific DNA-methyltransferase [Campylobacter sp. 19-13652]|uniref:site-specific DNA-methyltransferase n=1 Tax=Campylobacter sp. 19-13652 TaxID=2840180 RepID=UPI001C750799|nr:site-specific DNA-methyltransferase [Campylobacter sp. 19-13652]BCX79723.1 hypothetical protein LBC_11850 [Campylobacter sp. 19-13652]
MSINKDKLKQNSISYQDPNEPQSNRLLEFLKLNYPSSVKDGVPSINAIASILGLSVQNANLGYELNFTGKPIANALYNTISTKALHEARNTSENAPNQIIIGDNLDALKLLRPAYADKVKLIYIDPPYNTGGDGFIYPDDFRGDYRQILREVGLIEIDDDGNETESELIKSFKNLKGSKNHSGWLCFMLPRLKLARDLLRDDGVIFISIDDNEQANLKLLCDEIFGEENFVANFIWEKKFSPSNDAKFISFNHDYVLCYTKDINKLNINLLPRTDDMNARYKNPDNDPRGPWTSSDLSVKTYSAECDYPITTPSGRVVEPPAGRSWRLSKNTFLERLADGRIWFGVGGDGAPRIKRFLSEVQDGLKAVSILKHSEVGHNQEASKELVKIFDGHSTFDTPKPVRLLKHILKLATSPNSDDIILDFFAGSGTTAQAVIEQNREDGGNRKFILVQLDEKIDEKRSKAAYDFVKNELKADEPKISDITCERVRRVGGDFEVYELKEKAKIENKNGTLSLSASELSPKDRAKNMALFSGLELDVALKEIVKDELYLADDSYFLISANADTLLKIKSGKKVYLDGFYDFKLSDVLNLKQSNEIEFIF